MNMKFNPLLDSFPTEYMGYPMNTDFRVGILLTKLFSSGKFTDEEKKIQALKIAYNDIPDDILLAWKGIEWFLSVGNNKCSNTVEETKDKDTDDDEDTMVDSKGNKLIFDTDYKESSDVLDFDFDASRIYSGFLRTYGVDLTEVNMHFFKFMFMLADLESDCSHSKVVEIRTTPLKDKKGKERASYIKLKKMYEIPTEIDEESKAKLAEVGLDESDLEMYMQF